MPSTKEVHLAKKARVDSAMKYFAEAEANLAKSEANLAKAQTCDVEEWRRKADWLIRLYLTYKTGCYPVEVCAEKQQLERNEAFWSYYGFYMSWFCCDEFFKGCVEDLHIFEAANGLGEHQVLSHHPTFVALFVGEHRFALRAWLHE